MLLHPAPLVQTAADLRSGRLDLFAYINAALDRLGAVDSQVHAFVPEADRRTRLRHDAKMLLARYPQPESRPPLFGVLVGVKDMFRTADLPTRAGSLLPGETFGRDESAVVATLKDAGALILGKTVTTEFACFEPGETRNPHNLEHTPGGSSSGSAAAMAAGLCPLTLGTQTISSVIRPAAFCGVVGYKPTYRRIDPSGVIFIAPSLDHVGLFTQDVAGMALALSVVCPDWTPVNAERSPVLGVPVGAFLDQVPTEMLALFESHVAQLEAAGYEVKRVAALANIEEITAYHVDLMNGEMAQVHVDWFARYESLYRPRTVALIQKGQAVDETRLAAARDAQQATRAALEQTMDEAGIDVWLSPSALSSAPRGLDVTGSPAMCFPWTFAGLPDITLPAGKGENDMPVGLQCVARSGADEWLLAWSGEIESVLKHSK